MKTGTQAKFQAIANYPFFRSVGEALPSTVKCVSSWSQAAKLCHSRKWKNNRLVARNALFDTVQKASWNRGQEWNPLVDDLNPQVTRLIDDLLHKVSVPQHLVDKIKPALLWDIVAICFEEEYRDLRAPAFYIPYLDPWYSNGRFPCGWDGEEFADDWNGVVQGERLIVF
jgi:hypothetical protein